MRRNTLDVSWRKFFDILSYKAEWAGKTMVKVDPSYTSQIYKYGKSLDRDYNASLNILERGLKKVGLGWSEFMPLEIVPPPELKIVLADRGQGVLKTLKKVKPELKNDSEALKTAFIERISGRAPEARGNGLKFTKESVKKEKMYLVFSSGNARAELNKEMKIKQIDENIKGCLAILTV